MAKEKNLFDVKKLLEGTLILTVKYAFLTLKIRPPTSPTLRQIQEEATVLRDAAGNEEIDENYVGRTAIERSIVEWSGPGVGGKSLPLTAKNLLELCDATPGLSNFINTILFDFDALYSEAMKYNEKN